MNRAARPRRAWRAAARWGALLLGLGLLWPAAWGGMTGITIVQGHSMEPTYRTGDVVITLRQPGYAVGDVVSYTVPEGQAGAGGHVIHRVATLEDSSPSPVYTTQGDNNPEPDLWRIGPADITGRALLHLPAIGRMLDGPARGLIVGGIVGLAVTLVLWPRTDAGAEAKLPADGAEADPTPR